MLKEISHVKFWVLAKLDLSIYENNPNLGHNKISNI